MIRRAAPWVAVLAIGAGCGASSSPASPAPEPATTISSGEPDAAAGQPSLLSSRELHRVLDGLPKGVGFVIAPLAAGKIQSQAPPKRPHAWSTIKPVIAAAVLRARRAGDLGDGRTPTARERSLIARAIENSDNEAAAALFAELGSVHQASQAMQRVLVDAGDNRTHVNERLTRPGYSTYGQTSWALGSEARFYRALVNGCLLGTKDTDVITHAMAHVSSIGGAGWGLPAAGFDRLRFKAGWGPERGTSAYTALQFGAVAGARSDGYVIGIVAETGEAATQAYGEVTAVAKRLRSALADRRRISGRPSC